MEDILVEGARYRLGVATDVFRKNQVVILTAFDEDYCSIRSLNNKKMDKVVRSSLNEIHSYESRYKRNEYVPVDLAIGDTFMFQYSNGASSVKVGIIENDMVILDEGSLGTSRNIKCALWAARVSMNNLKKAKFDKMEDSKEIANNLLFDINFASCKGGSLGNEDTVQEFMMYMRRLHKQCVKYNVDSNSLGGTYYGGTQLMRSRSGRALLYSINGVHHGGYYAGDTAYLVQAQVGGALELSVSRGILAATKSLFKKYSYYVVVENTGDAAKPTREIHSSIRETDGTNWSSILISAPSVYNGPCNERYYTIPSLNQL